jgi:hypothetical protein
VVAGEEAEEEKMKLKKTQKSERQVLRIHSL